MNYIQEGLVILILVLCFVSFLRWAPQKGLDKERKKLEKLQREYDSLIEYEPNVFTFIRDAGGFGRLDLSLIFYVPQMLFGLVLYVFGKLGYLSPEDVRQNFLILLIVPTITVLVGSYLKWKYPVTREYFLSFGKKR